MSFMPSEESLDQRQLEILKEIEEHPRKCYWIKGFAGSGKTVLLVYFAKRYLKNHPGASVWFLTYTHSLRQMVETGFPSGARVHIGTYKKFLWDQQHDRAPQFTDVILLDEVQDISKEELRALKGSCGWLIVAGDTDQRIFKQGQPEEVIEKVLDGSLYNKLNKIYRLTKKVCQLARVVLPKARIEEATTVNSEIKKGSDVYYKKYDSREDEILRTWELAKQEAIPDRPSVIILATHEDISSFATVLARSLNLERPPIPKIPEPGDWRPRNYWAFNSFWKANRVPLEYLGNSYGDLDRSNHEPMVYLMTYSSAKGLDFERVFLPFLDDDTAIVARVALDSIPDLDRKLLYVAVTRTRSDLYLSYSSWSPHRFLQEIIDSGTATELKDEAEANEDEEDEDEDFF